MSDSSLAYAAHGIRFYVPEVAYADAEEYLPALLSKRGKSNNDLPATLAYLKSLIEPVGGEEYGLFESEARQRMRGRDEEGWAVLAAALSFPVESGRRILISSGRA